MKRAKRHRDRVSNHSRLSVLSAARRRHGVALRLAGRSWSSSIPGRGRPPRQRHCSPIDLGRSPSIIHPETASKCFVRPTDTRSRAGAERLPSILPLANPSARRVQRAVRRLYSEHHPLSSCTPQSPGSVCPPAGAYLPSSSILRNSRYALRTPGSKVTRLGPLITTSRRSASR